MRERLKADPSEAMCKYIFAPAIEEENRRSFYNMADINMAHVLMLKKQHILDEDAAKVLLKALYQMAQDGPSCMEVHPEFEDYYFNVEQYMIAKVGKEIGGKLHTARSRNDLGSTLMRMNARDQLIRLIGMTITLRDSILRLAERYRDQVVTGYTHMQPAQPISLAYYLTAVSQALGRDIDRLKDAYQRMNESTLGACAFAGTSFPVDRQFTAEQLGFRGPMRNSMDAVASKDYLLEICGAFTILGSNLNRFATDLYFWSTDEFRYIEVDDSLAVCSSIMPQKKNPISIEHVKAKTSHLLAAFVSITTVLKGIPYCHNRDGGAESSHLFWDACSQMEAILAVLNETVVTIKVKCDKMKERANSNYSTVTELADELVKSEHLPFRTAHEIVAKIVRDCLDQGLTSMDITTEMLDSAAMRLTGKTFHWPQEKIRRVLDAEHSVRSRISYGAPSPQECAGMLAEQTAATQKAAAWLQAEKDRLCKTREALHGYVKEVALN